MTTTTTAQPRIRHTPECRPTAADYVKTSSTQPERNIS